MTTVNRNNSLFLWSTAQTRPHLPTYGESERNRDPKMFEVMQNHLHMEKLEE